jgi:hypothetical protein
LVFDVHTYADLPFCNQFLLCRELQHIDGSGFFGVDHDGRMNLNTDWLQHNAYTLLHRGKEKKKVLKAPIIERLLPNHLHACSAAVVFPYINYYWNTHCGLLVEWI